MLILLLRQVLLELLVRKVLAPASTGTTTASRLSLCLLYSMALCRLPGRPVAPALVGERALIRHPH